MCPGEREPRLPIVSPQPRGLQTRGPWVGTRAVREHWSMPFPRGARV